MHTTSSKMLRYVTCLGMIEKQLQRYNYPAPLRRKALLITKQHKLNAELAEAVIKPNAELLLEHCVKQVLSKMMQRP